jgi:hypothetical protein
MTLWRDEYVYSGHGKIRRVGASRHFCFTASPVSACIAELRLNDDTFTMSPFSSLASFLVLLTRGRIFGIGLLLGLDLHGIHLYYVQHSPGLTLLPFRSFDT